MPDYRIAKKDFAASWFCQVSGVGGERVIQDGDRIKVVVGASFPQSALHPQIQPLCGLAGYTDGCKQTRTMWSCGY